MRRVEPVLRKSLRGSCAVPEGARILVAVSGGADSTALLLGLSRLAGEFGYSVCAAHLNHGLRGAEADRDQLHVRRLCRSLGVPLRSARWDTRERMRRRGLSGQAGLRRLRRQFLKEAARRSGAVAIATAHHADDQLETLLGRLLRGAGLDGLGAMSGRRGIWLKPLLGATRADIEADLRRGGVSWREDASNADPRYLRTRVRLHAVPALLRVIEGSGPAGVRGRAALALRVEAGLREVRQARRLVEAVAAELLAAARCDRAAEPGPGIVLDLAALAGAPRIVRAAALKRAWKELAPGVGLTSRHVEALLALASGPPRRGMLSLPRDLIARRSGQRLEIGRARPTDKSL